ncbi:hypothetical protein D3C81_10350 [compost metagenome]
MTFKRVITISISVGLGLLAILFLLTVNQKVQIAKINSSRDTSLLNYKYAKGVAADTAKLILTNDKPTYANLSKKLEKTLSSELADMYIKSDKKFVDTDYNITFNSVKGEFIGDNEFLFKVDTTVFMKTRTQSIRLLIGVNNGIVSSIESIGS